MTRPRSPASEIARRGWRTGVAAVIAFTPALVAAQAGHAQSAFPRSMQQPSGYTGVQGRAAPASTYADLAGYGAHDPAMQGERVRVDLAGGGSHGRVRTLSLPRGKSAVIELPIDAKDVLVSDPKVADVVLSTPRRIYVMGMGSGETDAAFFDVSGRELLRLDIRVDQDVSAVGQTLARVMPGSAVRVDAVNQNIILSGEVANAAEADKAVRIAASFVAKPEQVLNMLSIRGGEQVMLKVKIVEMNRTVIKQLGFDLNAITGQLGMPQYSFLKSPTYGVNNTFLGGASGGYSLNTTSQPVSGFPFGNLFPGLSQATGLIQSAASVAGIAVGDISTVASKYLTGGGAGLTAAQSQFSQTYYSGLLGQLTTQVTPVVTAADGTTSAGTPYTVDANLAGVTPGNLPSLQQQFLNNPGSLNANQRSYLTALNNQLPTYNAAAKYSVTAAQDSTYRDRSNPANVVGTGRAGSTGLNQANAMIQAFERVGLIRTLAEPNLSAVSGESAKFLAGGEFPVPVGQDNNGRVTVEFKPYGVGLGFTPVVLSNGRISLKLSTEVSELTSVGAFSLANTNANSTSPTLSVPGLTVRRAETTVELPSGGAMMIAGLMQSQTKQTLDSLPGLMQVPILGALLRSRDFQSNETELVVIVTPYLVNSVRPEQLQTPVDGLQIADDVSTNLLGKMNKNYAKPRAAGAGPAPAPGGATYQGPYGYVVE